MNNEESVIHLDSESDPSNGNRLQLNLGAYGWTVIRGRGSYESMVEQAAEYCSEHLPGLLSQLSDFDQDSLNEDGEPIDHIYTECGYFPSWELSITEI